MVNITKSKGFTIAVFFVSFLLLQYSTFINVPLFGRLILFIVFISSYLYFSIKRYNFYVPKIISVTNNVLMVFYFFLVTYGLFILSSDTGVAAMSVVNGSSMQPTINDGDIVLAGNPVNFERGDIVLYNIPSYGMRYCENGQLGRIIGFPEDYLRITREGVEVNGRRIVESYVHSTTNISFTGTFTVPLKEYFIASDDREKYCNSAVIGTIPSDYILAKIISHYSERESNLFLVHNIIVGLFYSAILTVSFAQQDLSEVKGISFYIAVFISMLLFTILYFAIEYQIKEGRWFALASSYYVARNFVSFIFIDSPLAIVTNVVLLLIGLVASIIEIRNFIESRQKP